MADSSVSSVRSEAVQPQLIEDEIAELKRKLEDAQERLNAVTDAASRAFPSQPTVSNNVHHAATSSHFLLLLADSALPLGSFAFSSGLESYIAHNRPPSFTKFMTLSLSSHASATLPFVLAGYRNPERLLELDDALDGAIMCTVGRRASVAQGRALLSIWDRAFSSAIPMSTDAEEGTLKVLKNFSALLRSANASTDDLPPASAHLAPLFGVIARITGVGEQEMAYVYMLSHVKALLSAAVRASVFGPYQAQKLLASREVQEGIEGVITAHWGRRTEDAGQTVPFQAKVLAGLIPYGFTVKSATQGQTLTSKVDAHHGHKLYNCYRDVPPFIFDWMRAHPGQAVFYVVNGILVFTPAALTGPLLTSMGWGASGPVAGSVAASLQTMLGNVGAGSIFAYLQSAAMGGYGVAAVNGVAQACVGSAG
ncbi:hypothetical protein V502_09630 [Pseudogymnoascus sp. VKM F-4520 (FW-2644)]|nr:hypothetical protein V502_09630 [Pseudogymnoascus sp. VKM F-4520 (FW-2644)]